jgi:hypothetical protein
MNPLRSTDEEELGTLSRNALNRLLKKQEQSLYNRLRSIVFDASYVRGICRCEIVLVSGGPDSDTDASVELLLLMYRLKSDT